MAEKPWRRVLSVRWHPLSAAIETHLLKGAEGFKTLIVRSVSRVKPTWTHSFGTRSVCVSSWPLALQLQCRGFP